MHCKEARPQKVEMTLFLSALYFHVVCMKEFCKQLCRDWLAAKLTSLHALRSRMKRAQSTPHAMAMATRQASIEPFGSLHGHNGYGALMEEQKLKNRCAPAGRRFATVLTQVGCAFTAPVQLLSPASPRVLLFCPQC